MIAEVLCPGKPLEKYLWGNIITYTIISLPDYLTISSKGHLSSGCSGELAKNWYTIKPSSKKGCSTGICLVSAFILDLQKCMFEACRCLWKLESRPAQVSCGSSHRSRFCVDLRQRMARQHHCSCLPGLDCAGTHWPRPAHCVSYTHSSPQHCPCSEPPPASLDMCHCTADRTVLWFWEQATYHHFIKRPT